MGENETAKEPPDLTTQTASLEADLRERIFAPLGRLRRRCRLYLSLHGLRDLTIVLIVSAVVQLALDRWFRLSVDKRAALSAVVALVCAAVAVRRLILPLLRPLPDRFLAALVDRAHPEMCERLTTAVQLAPFTRARGAPPADGASAALVRHVLHQTCQSAAALPFVNVLNHARAARRLIEAVALWLLVALALGLGSELLGTWFARNWLWQDVPWPQRTHIWPDGFGADGRRRLARGDVVEITATVTGELPATANLDWRSPAGRHGREPMSIVGDTQLVASIGQLSEEVRFRIAGGDERTREFVVEPVERPRVLHTLARITPPAYTHVEPIVIEQQTVLEVLHGATLELTAMLNKPVKSARFVNAEGVDAPCGVAIGAAVQNSESRVKSEEEPAAADAAESPEQVVSISWAAPESGTYRLELVDYDDLTAQNPVRFTLKVVPDRPPAVRMELAGVGELITPQAELPIELHCQDAYGLGSVRLLIQAGTRAERPQSIEGVTPGARSFSTTLTLPAPSVGVVPGDPLRIWAEASDLDPAGPNVSATPVTALRVVSREEFQMELARRELVLRQEFERLRSAQRSLKDTLERLVPELPAVGAPSDNVAQRLAGLARNQSQSAGRCLALGQGFSQILAEMRVSRTAHAADERRILDRIVDPLGHLARETIPSAAEKLTALRQTAGAEARQAALAAQVDVLRQMDEILGNMLEWEGYRETVTLLQEIIAAQSGVRTETLEALQRQVDDILRLTEPDASPDTQPAEP